MFACMSDAANETDAVESIGPAGGLVAKGEDLITLTEAARRLPKIDGRKICAGTIWRWCRFGLRGVWLEHVRLGRKICTSQEALTRFFAALADLDDFYPLPTPARLKRRAITSRQRLRALREADAILEEAGI